jgi:hypothetical protein
MMSLIKVRLENLKTINKYNPERIIYIENELELQADLKVIKAWWLHYKWLKNNKLDYRQYPEHKQFLKLCKTHSIRLRLQDIHLSKQAMVIA